LPRTYSLRQVSRKRKTGVLPGDQGHMQLMGQQGGGKTAGPTDLHGEAWPQAQESHSLLLLPQPHFQSPCQETMAGVPLTLTGPDRTGGGMIECA
jgi:hypothetical protein